MSKLWGGRFEKPTEKLVEDFTRSIDFDIKLARYDIVGSILHVKILHKANLLTVEEKDRLCKALNEIQDTITEGTFKLFDKNSEDIHTDIQKQVEEKVGDLVLKLHTARSRNDQVVFAIKFYSKYEILLIEKFLLELNVAFVELAKKNISIIIPGFTHLHHAQPVLLGDYLMAYVSMLDRDKQRLKSIWDRIEITMGSGALAGTPINHADYNSLTDNVLRSSKISQLIEVKAASNSLDAVSDRDFIIETLGAFSILAMHLSRLSEDLILWSTKEFDFIEIDDAYCTGSSLMPQKKNPDVLELIRGYSGRVYGNLVNVLTMMKGLPLSYNRDMQLDKEPLFDSVEIISKSLNVLKGLIKTLTFNEDKIRKHLKDEALYATDLVYYLIEKGIPFKKAHTVIGELFSYSIKNKLPIKSMPESLLKEKFSDKFVKKEIKRLFNPEVSVASKKSINRPDYNEIIHKGSLN